MGENVCISDLKRDTINRYNRDIHAGWDAGVMGNPIPFETIHAMHVDVCLMSENPTVNYHLNDSP